MDPFVLIEYSGQKYHTKTLQESDTRPVWNQLFDIPVFNKDQKLLIQCQEEDVAYNDDLGKGDFDINQFLTQ